MTPSEIEHLDEIEEILVAPRFLLFKHSSRCGTSDRAFAQYLRFAETNPDLPTAWLDVVKQQSWSEHVAAETGVPHESPQALFFQDGDVAWHASHWDITTGALAEAIEA
ncbi:MAG: bacillithiol system redox-active protein YtxJ [Planctomycetota bacterium]